MQGSHSGKSSNWDGPGTYRIRVRGSLDEKWSDRMGGMAITRDSSRFFTLTPLPEAQARSAPADGSEGMEGLTYGLGPIKLPAYLDRGEVATRVAATEIRYSGTDRWAEPLQANVTRVLLQNLSTLLGTDRIVVYPWFGSTKVDYQIEIEVLRFEHDASGESQLTARWAVKGGRKDGYLLLRESNLTRPKTNGETAAAVAGLSATLGDLSREIVSALQELEQQRV